MRFQRIVWLNSNAEINPLKNKWVSIQNNFSHSTKFVEFFVKEHHTLYQTCGKVNLFISIRNLFSTRVFSKKIIKNAKRLSEEHCHIYCYKYCHGKLKYLNKSAKSLCNRVHDVW